MRKQLKIFLDKEFDPGFEERARYIFEAVEKYKPKNVLDCGCGRGFYVNALSFIPTIKKIVGIDINKNHIEKAKKNKCSNKTVFQVGSIYHMPFNKNSFDMIICSEVLEHLKYEDTALKEIKRILKKDGVLVTTVPHYNFPFMWDPLNWILQNIFHTHINKGIWWLAGIWADHMKLFTEENLIKLLERNTFEIKNISRRVFFSWPFMHFFLYGIGKNIVELFPDNSINRFNIKNDNRLVNIFASFVKYPSRLKPSGKGFLNLCTIARVKK